MIRYSAIVSDGSFPCNTAVLQGDMETVFRQAKEAGYDCVQLTIRDRSDYSAEDLRMLSETYGVTISAMATGRIYSVDGYSMAPSDERNRQTCLERLRDLADFSVSIGRPAIVIGAVRGRYTDPAETLRYAESIHSPCLHMYLDTMHLYNEGVDIAEAIRMYGPHSWQIDISGENRTSPMDSAIDFSKVAEAIRASGFQGTLAFEMPPSPPEGSARKSLEYIRRLIERASPTP